MLSQNSIDIKMISIFQLTKIDGLSAHIDNTNAIAFTFLHRGLRKPLVRMPIILFEKLEPIEIRGSLERALITGYDIDGKGLRIDLSGFKKDPFSSQN
jgi:hypothetical protein